jgi:hypothetical protein
MVRQFNSRNGPSKIYLLVHQQLLLFSQFSPCEATHFIEAMVSLPETALKTVFLNIIESVFSKHFLIWERAKNCRWPRQIVNFSNEFLSQEADITGHLSSFKPPSSQKR